MWRRGLVVFLALTVSVFGQQPRSDDKATVDGPTHENVEVECDLPTEQHVKNFGAPNDQKGLCVFASMTMLARWHHVRPLMDVIHKLKTGGGWPERVDMVIKEYSPNLKYIQYEGVDPGIMDEALSERRAACVTYGYSERYSMQTIYHMVLLVHLDKSFACVIDNNFPGTFEWMSREQFLKRWKHPNGQGWAYTFLVAPPPPIPRGDY